MFLAINSITYDKNKYYDKIKSLNKKSDKPLEVKIFKVQTDNEKELLKYLSPRYYSIFKNIKNGKSNTITEDDLLR